MPRSWMKGSPAGPLASISAASSQLSSRNACASGGGGDGSKASSHTALPHEPPSQGGVPNWYWVKRP